MARPELEGQPVKRWTISRSAKAVHDAVLAPAGFVRKGTTSWRDDFLHREVYFYAERFTPADQRTLVVSFTLSWLDAPTGAPELFVGGALRQRFLQPVDPGGVLDPSVLTAVSGPVLAYLERPDSPSAFVDQLLACEGSAEDRRGGPLSIIYGPAVHYSAAAWAALALGDADRCRLAVQKALQVFQDDAQFHVAVALREEMTQLAKVWQERHGSLL